MGDKKRILIIEDEKNIARLLAFNLSQNGYAYDVAYDGKEGCDKALGEDFDLILLDLMLPKMDGFEVCRQVRKCKSVPIIILTARQEEVDKITGLDIGADDYVTKPFAINELISRIAANIRRASGNVSPHASSSDTINIRDLSIDTSKDRVCVAGREISLTKTEYELLLFLSKNPGAVYGREELLRKVWGYDPDYSDERIVDVTVRRLRAKIESDPANPEYILTKHRMGYYVG